MCGIVGILNLATDVPIREIDLRQMLAMIRHRGPDQFGIYLDDRVGLGSARLSIIDLATGQQPISNEDETLWIVFNGEIFNYRELRPDLERRGYRFATETDTEVLLHLYEEFGVDCLSKLNGQFAFAIWNSRDKTLFLARDRLGVRPLFYTQAGGALIFASEIKAIFADPRVRAEIDPVALNQIFSYWSTLSPRTVYRGIVELPPGHYVLARRGKIAVKRYWQLCFEPQPSDFNDCVEEFGALLTDATLIRLHADVPVGAYLSGGLDSSIITALIRGSGHRLDSFSIAFDDPRFDESKHQRAMAQYLGTQHQVVVATHEDIGRDFSEVIWHTETPILRTAPAPMFLLSKLVRDHGYKVVLTGEGADEFLGGYDIFKEAIIRQFWARQPDSMRRSRLLQRLYPDIHLSDSAFLTAFFREGLLDTMAPEYSHAVRWRNGRRLRRFLSEEMRNDDLEYPPGFLQWGMLERAQYLEATIFLSQYLLSSQGDRMSMAHGVEGRFPFLDYRLVEFCCRLPSRFKLRGLKEKYLLKILGRKLLPPEIWQRTKRPYRAPIHQCLLGLVSLEQIAATGLFRAKAVAQLVRKIESGVVVSESDDMALAGIVSTQLVHQLFVANFKIPPPLSDRDDVKVCHEFQPSSARY